MKFFEGIGNIFLFSLLMFLLECIAINKGYSGKFPSADAQYIVDGLIMAGTLASEK